MASTISWIDYNPTEREASMKALALLKTSDSRDELGIGAIRDSLSDLLFPGTSTLHTKLRYFLIIPWMYKRIETRGIKSINFARTAERHERHLIEALKKNSDTEGVIGLRAGKDLKILPSTMYWSGLRNWGLFELDKTKGEYFNLIDSVYKARTIYKKTLKSRKSRSDEWQDDRYSMAKTWQEVLPKAPEGFPNEINLEVTYDEAVYLQDRILYSQKDSLLAFLAKNIIKSNAEHPKVHELYDEFSDSHKKQVDTAYNFALLIQGAALLYNLMLSELSDKDSLVQKYKERIREWEDKARLLNGWDISELWDTVYYPGSAHNITLQARQFVEAWFSIYKDKQLYENQKARELIETRERKLKRTKSRFASAHMLDIWGESSGTGFIDNRWHIARVLLNDLYDGLERG